MELAWGARSDVGRVRKRNEDAVLAVGRVFAVADGMGGHADGNVASAMTIEALQHLATRPEVHRSDVLETVRRVDAEIRFRASGQSRGMGTTVTGLAVLGDDTKLLVFNVGDSRCYRLRDRSLVQLTHDHSVVQELMDAGAITPAEAEQHEDRNVITRSLGSDDLLEIDWWLTEPQTGDRFLLCSDGVSREIDATRIAQILGAGADPQTTAEDLVAAALDAGGRDNASVVVVDVANMDDPIGATEPAPPGGDPMDEDTEPRVAGLVADTATPLVAAPPVSTDLDQGPPS